jgi:hypothetical protein
VAIAIGAQAQGTIAQSVPTPAASPPVVKPAAPFVPTPQGVVTEMLKLANPTHTDVVYDLGSGDGRLVITAVQQFGAKRGVGVEIAPELIQRSQKNAQVAGVSDRVQFLQQDLFQTDLSDASVVTLYLSPAANRQLRPKLLSELKPGSRIVSHAFTMGDWQPDQVVQIPRGARTLYYWVVPATVAGEWQGSLEPSPGQRQPVTLQFNQKFQTVEMTLVAAGKPTGRYQGKLAGNAFNLSSRTNLEGQSELIEFTGQVNDNTLTGTMKLPDRSGLVATITATRRSSAANPKLP